MTDVPVEGDIVSVSKPIPRPEDWVRMDDCSYYYVHKETDQQIHEEAYDAKVRRRKTLAAFIDEVPEPPEE